MYRRSDGLYNKGVGIYLRVSGYPRAIIKEIKIDGISVMPIEVAGYTQSQWDTIQSKANQVLDILEAVRPFNCIVPNRALKGLNNLLQSNGARYIIKDIPLSDEALQALEWIRECNKTKGGSL